jgi:hypothetical protein
MELYFYFSSMPFWQVRKWIPLAFKMFWIQWTAYHTDSAMHNSFDIPYFITSYNHWLAYGVYWVTPGTPNIPKFGLHVQFLSLYF